MMRKYAAMLFAMVLILCSFTACAEKVLTPEEYFDLVMEEEKVRMELYVNYGDIQSSTTVIEKDGDRTRVYMETASFGAADGDEYYTSKEDGKLYLYAPDENGVWEKEEVGDWFTPATIEGMASLFDDDLYYKTEEGDYRMYKSSSVEMVGLTLSDVEVLRDEDGKYYLTAVVTRTIEEMPVYGSAKITFSKFGKVNVTLPKVG